MHENSDYTGSGRSLALIEDFFRGDDDPFLSAEFESLRWFPLPGEILAAQRSR